MMPEGGIGVIQDPACPEAARFERKAAWHVVRGSLRKDCAAALRPFPA